MLVFGQLRELLLGCSFWIEGFCDYKVSIFFHFLLTLYPILLMCSCSTKGQVSSVIMEPEAEQEGKGLRWQAGAEGTGVSAMV